MKRLGLFLLTAFVALVFTACNDSDGDYPRYTAFATVVPFGNHDFYLELDNGETLYPADKSRIATYDAQPDQRVTAAFNLLKEKRDGYDQTIALYYLRNIYTGQTEIVSTPEQLDTLADAKTSFLGARLNSNYLNVGIGFKATDLKLQSFMLVRNDQAKLDPEETEDGYLNLELRRDAHDDTETRLYENQYVSFPLGTFEQDLKGKKGIILRMNTRLNGVQYIRIEMIAD